MSDSLQTAVELMQRGDLSAALTAFDSALARQPNDVATLSAYASALRRAGRIEQALQLYARALEVLPGEPALHFNRANALRAAGRGLQARDSYRRALAINSQFVPAWVNLGRLEQDSGNDEAAIDAYSQALALDPQQLSAAMNRGNCLRRLGQLDAAVSSHQQALRLAPRHAEIHYNLGNALRERGDTKAAIASFAAALAADPAPIELWSRLGVSLQQMGQSEQALAVFDRGRREHSRIATAHCNYGHMAMRLGQVQPGIEALRLAVRLEPGEPIATAHLVDALVRTGFVGEAVELAESALRLTTAAVDQARLHNVLGNARGSVGEVTLALNHLQQAHDLDPDASSISNLAFMSLYCEDIDAAAKAQLQRDLAAGLVGLQSARTSPVGDTSAGEDRGRGQSCSVATTNADRVGGVGQRRLRVGYLSADLLDHPVGFFIQPLLGAHDRQTFEVYVYNDSERRDAVTERLHKVAEHWCEVRGLDDRALEQQMRSDDLDLLIELAGHTAGNRLPLLARRPAPRQISYLGYPFTTGLAAIDGLIGDTVTTPVSEAALYHEDVLRLPHFAFCFQPHPNSPPVAPAPVLSRGYLTFGCCNSFNKIGPATLKLWVRLLQSLPLSRLLLRALGLNDGATCVRLREMFLNEGIDPQRVDLLPPTRPIEAYLASYDQIDIALDPLAYNGGTTSFEALWQGVPVLTIAGSGFCARMGAGINASAGLSEFSASDESDFLAIAQQWSERGAELAQLRAGLRERLTQTSLFNPDLFMPGFESALLAVAQRRR